MDSLTYLKSAATYPKLDPKDFRTSVRVKLITNFTDDVLRNMFVGVALTENVYPTIKSVPYRQYHLHLKNTAQGPLSGAADITFFFFDMNPFKGSEFATAKEHFAEILGDIERYAKEVPGTVMVASFIQSYQSVYGNLVAEDPLFNLVAKYNGDLTELASRVPNVRIFDTNRLVHILGEKNVFDLRGLYAFDMPFTQEFTAMLAREWFAVIRAQIGRSKKCIILDLDNTLWGGVVGETGPLGIALGPDYPGNAFVAFQRALLDFYNRGIILAINSRNNAEDVAEVFAKNPHMVLAEKHFSAICTNWDDKATNVGNIAEELNIGTDSMVFLDDDPLNRAMVADRFPEVLVPDFSLPPEEYVQVLYATDVFRQFALTDEDKAKGQMYAEERQRKTVEKTVKSVAEYIAELGITVRMDVNATSSLPRLAQLTQKTNQFNLTTKRYTESQLETIITSGGYIFSASVTDKFGDYGTVIMAIVIPNVANAGEATLDTFLMSCRSMGRGIECIFLDRILKYLDKKHIKTLHTSFIPTAKNKPVEPFPGEHGFHEAPSRQGAEGVRNYILHIAKYRTHPCPEVNPAITIEEHFAHG